MQQLPFRLLGLFAVFVMALLPLSVSAEQDSVEGEYLASVNTLRLRLIVSGLEEYSDEQITEAVHELLDLEIQDEIPLVNAHVSELQSNGDLLDDASRTEALYHLVNSGSLNYIEPNFLYHTGTTPTVTPNDPSFATTWGMHHGNDHDVNAPEAWGLTTGSSDVVVAILDTGIDTDHPDLVNNLWVNTAEIPGNGIDDDNNGYIDDVYGINAITGLGNPEDDQYHGTHVAGTIGAVGNNGIGVAGVAWNVKLMALKFLNSSGSGSLADAIKCIQYMVTMKNRGVPITVSNNSWGGGGYSIALEQAIQAANTADIIFVAAAGNDASNNDALPSYPASYNVANVVSVAAHDINGNLASFTNYGATSVDISAPGVNIYSTWPGGGYNSISGTSMATPHVSGVFALMFSQNDLSVAAAISTLYSTRKVRAGFNGKMLYPGMANAGDALGVHWNYGPTLSPISDQIVPLGEISHEVPFSVSDPEEDPITCEAEVFNGNPIHYALDQTYGFIPHPDGFQQNAYGLGEKHFLGANNKQYFALIDNGRTHIFEFLSYTAPFVYALAVYDEDGIELYDNLLNWLIQAQPSYPTPPRATISGHNILLTDLPPQVDDFFDVTLRCTSQATEGPVSVSSTFRVTIGSLAPILHVIEDQEVARGASILVLLSSSLPSGNPAQYSVTEVQVLSNLGSAASPVLAGSFSGNTLTLVQNGGFVGEAQVSVQVSDGLLSDTKTFKAKWYNQAPHFSAISNKSLPANGNISFAVHASDPDGDALVFGVKSMSSGPGGSKPNIQISGNTVKLFGAQAAPGNYIVTLSAQDNFLAKDEKSFTVAVTKASSSSPPSIPPETSTPAGTPSPAPTATPTPAPSLKPLPTLVPGIVDSDGDGNSDEQEKLDGSNPRDAGDYLRALRSPAFLAYEATPDLRQHLELFGSGQEWIDISLLGDSGSVLYRTQVDLSRGSASLALPVFSAGTTVSVQLNFNEKKSFAAYLHQLTAGGLPAGRVTLLAETFGKTQANSLPSRSEAVLLVNPSATQQAYALSHFNAKGKLVTSEDVLVKPGAAEKRSFAVSGGRVEVLAKPGVPYFAYVQRDSQVQRILAATKIKVYVPIMRSKQDRVVLFLNNPGKVPTNFTVNLFSGQGKRLNSLKKTLAAGRKSKAQFRLPRNFQGFATVHANKVNSLLAVARYTDKRTGSQFDLLARDDFDKSVYEYWSNMTRARAADAREKKRK